MFSTNTSLITKYILFYLKYEMKYYYHLYILKICNSFITRHYLYAIVEQEIIAMIDHIL